jgi:hypothetical protein
MLSHPTLDQLHALGLHGMVKGFKELDANPEARALEHPSGSSLGIAPWPRPGSARDRSW